MKIALFQFDTLWEQKEHNLNQVETLTEQLTEQVDLVVLPEMFTTGFSMNPMLLAEEANGATLAFIQNLANKHNTAFVGSWATRVEHNFYNRLYFVTPNGKVDTYDKRHLFSLAGEEKHYSQGGEKKIIHYKGWNICPLICYDLRFPVHSRMTGESYDLLLYIASWPDKRIYAWDTLLKARAIENMTYVIGVNRCGTDPKSVYYSGHSQAIDFMGASIIPPFEGTQTKILTLDKNSLQNARTKLGFLNDRDQFEIKF